MLQDPCLLSLVVKWLRLCASTAGHTGSILGQRVPHATWPEKKQENKIPVLNGTSQKK